MNFRLCIPNLYIVCIGWVLVGMGGEGGTSGTIDTECSIEKAWVTEKVFDCPTEPSTSAIGKGSNLLSITKIT